MVESNLYLKNINNDEKSINYPEELLSKLQHDSNMRFNRLHEEMTKPVIKTVFSEEYFSKLNADNIKLKPILSGNIKCEIEIKIFLQIISNLATISSIIVYIIQTCYDKILTLDPNDKYAISQIEILQKVELVFAFYFLFEFILYLISRYSIIFDTIFSMNTVIDCLTIFPSLYSFFSKEKALKWSFFRAFRFIRIFRLYKLLKIFQTLEKRIELESSDESQIETNNPIRKQFFVLFVVLICSLFMGSGFVLGIQSLVDNAFNIGVMNFFDAFYFMIITCTTIGYGDIVPTSTISRLFIVVMLFTLFIIITNQITTIINLFSVWGPSLVVYNGTGHLIVFADTSTNLKTFLEEIRVRKGKIHIVILSQDIPSLESKSFPFNKVVLINYDISNLEFLARSNISKASAIFIFSNKSTKNCLLNEKFIDSLLVKSNLFNNEIPIYIQSLYSEKNFHEIGKIKLKMKKNISIFKLKSLIIAKSLFNPGYTTFIQNLMFNHYNLSLLNFDSFSPLYKEYQLGCQYKIHIFKIPICLENKTFTEALKIIYFKSIKNCILQKNYNYIKDRPILLLGLVESSITSHIKEKVQMFPSDMKIPHDTEGVFLGYNDQSDKHLEDFLSKLELKEDDDELEIKDILRLKTVTYNTKFPTNIQNNDDDIRRKSITLRAKGNKPSRFSKFSKDQRNSISISKEHSNIANFNIRNNNIVSNNNNNNLMNENNIVADNNSQSQELFKKFGFDTTLKNINSELKFDNKLAPETKKLIKTKLEKFCGKRYRDLHDKEKENNIIDYLLENRIYDLNKESATCETILFSNHILIIGYQDNLIVLLKMLSFYFETKIICLVNNEKKIEGEIMKLMKYFNNLKYLKGDYCSPKILLKAGIQQCYYTLILCENIDPKIKEDINNLVAFRSTEYYFNAKIILELWNYESINLLGNIPIDKKNKIINNEFLNPHFMSGKLIYLNHFEKMIAESYLNEKITETWLNLIHNGYRSHKEHAKTTKKLLNLKKTKSENQNIPENDLIILNTFPLFVTIDVPEYYEKKEFHFLVADLLSLSCIPLGLFLEDPTIYSGMVEIYQVQNHTFTGSNKSTINKLDLQTSSKKIINIDENTTAMKMLKTVSYNNKNFLDFQDFDNNCEPIFLTNPSPNFILLKNTKVQVIYNYHVKDDVSQNLISDDAKLKLNENNDLKEKKVSNYLQYKLKMKLLKKQENFFIYYQNLREKYLNEYNKVINKIENIG